MKNLLLLILILLALTGCKKIEPNKLSSKTEVHYEFITAGAVAQIIYTSISDNKTITVENITTPAVVAGQIKYHTVVDFVKSGDNVNIKMILKPVQTGYYISITREKDLSNGTKVKTAFQINPSISTDNTGKVIISVDKKFTAEELQ